MMSLIKITDIEVNDGTEVNFLPKEMILELDIQGLDFEEVEEKIGDVMYQIFGYGTNCTYSLVD